MPTRKSIPSKFLFSSKTSENKWMQNDYFSTVRCSRYDLASDMVQVYYWWRCFNEGLLFLFFVLRFFPCSYFLYCWTLHVCLAKPSAMADPAQASAQWSSLSKCCCMIFPQPLMFFVSLNVVFIYRFICIPANAINKSIK